MKKAIEKEGESCVTCFADGLCQLYLLASTATHSCVLPPRAGSALRSEIIKLALKSNKPTRSMSSVSEGSALAVVKSLGLQWIDGNKLYPIQPPAGGYGSIADFAMHKYPTEPKATPKFVEYLQVRHRLRLCSYCLCHACGSCALNKRATCHVVPINWLLVRLHVIAG